MTPEKAQLYLLEGAIREMDEETQIRIDALAAVLRQVLADHGDEAQAAFALVMAEQATAIAETQP